MVKQRIREIEKEMEVQGNEKRIIRMIKGMITLRCNYEELEFALEYVEGLYGKLGEGCEAARMRNTIKQICRNEEVCYTDSVEEISAITEDGIRTYGAQWADGYYEVNEDVIYLVIQAIRNNQEWRDDIEFINNIGWIWENLTERQNDAYILIDSVAVRKQEKDLLIQLLKILKKNVFVLTAEDGFVKEESGICSIRQEEGICYVSCQEKDIYDTVEYLCQHKIPDRLATVFATGNKLMQLSYGKQRMMKIERLSPYIAEQFENTITFGWAGDYRAYLSTIMKMDVNEDLEREPEYEFTILIPVRNNVHTLKYTIMTCLEQEYKGNYEIVVSDNSSPDYNEIKVFCEEQQRKHPNIRYYRTPRVLCANKSFEFAALKTRGEFVITIGADDGIMPWGLKVIDEVLQDTDADILRWDCAEYIWPGYGRGLDNLVSMKGGYQKGVYNLFEIPKTDFWSWIMSNYKTMYNLPNLYLNSGFRRRYLRKMYRKTGRIYDGRINDISIGIINICINDAITYLVYPITVAGNSSYSIGRAATRVHGLAHDFRGSLKGKGSIGYVAGLIESKYDPDVQKECASFYQIVLYEARKGIVPWEYVENLFDWKKMFWEVYSDMQPNDMYYERDINQLYSFAKLIGKDIAAWFEKEIYDVAFRRKPQKDDFVSETEKTYREGADATGAFMLDASKYGADNVFGAVKICKIASGL